VGGQNVGERKAALLQELVAERVDLLTETSLRVIEHQTGSEPV
jgi:hypothetical protein